MNTPSRIIGPEEVAASLGIRLDVFLAAAMGCSRARVQTLLKSGQVHLQPASARSERSYRLRAGDSIAIELEAEPAAAKGQPVGEAIPLEIIFEDEALLAINKQPGLVVHPAAGNWTGTLVNALVHHCGGHLAERGGGARLGIVHRLDKDTSGVMLIAKTDLAHERLTRSFAAREVRKIYRALCRGIFRRPSGELRGPIGRHPIHRKKMAVSKNEDRSRPAWTDYRVLRQAGPGAEVECVLHTGRTHQIRVHLSHLGHPIFGDTLYGRGNALSIPGLQPERQMLHAAKIEIAHPLTNQALTFEAPLPADYASCRDALFDPLLRAGKPL